MDASKYIVGTSGYSFADWVGEFYPPGTRPGEMFSFYAQRFQAVELNFTFYAMPSARTLASLAAKGPPGFAFWVKVNQAITHRQDRSAARPFIEALAPLREQSRLLGVLFQFPQSFHRTIDNRKFLSAALADFADPGLSPAVEFRHASWDHPSTIEGLRQRGTTLVIPDVPPIASLYRPAPRVTSQTAYLRLHSRDASKWYAGERERYDYGYSREELQDVVETWSEMESGVKSVNVFFNNCHRGQAAANAEAFRRIVGQIK
jgi:uncharacterized protein YecE (DUF72 family)